MSDVRSDWTIGEVQNLFELPLMELVRRAGAVHQQGYKVVLTGEGADEALAGYIWFKGQSLQRRLVGRPFADQVK